MPPYRALAAALSAATITLVLTPASAALAQDPPGFGDSEARPTGTPFELPEGIELKVVSYNPFDPDSCKRPDAEPGEEPFPMQGHATGQVNLCLQFTNNTFGPINVTLPPGIIWISSSDKHQNGILFETTSLEVWIGEYMVSLRADCMNTPRSAPGPGIPYETGPVTDNRHIREALGLMAGADLDDPMVSATASTLMKPLYEGKPLTNDTRRQLMELPRKAT